MLITDDAYDLLAYDGSNLANLGNFPQFVGKYGSAVGFHEVRLEPAGHSSACGWIQQLRYLVFGINTND